MKTALALAGLLISHAFAGEAPTTTANPSPTRLVTLGTQGGPRIQPTRAQPATLLSVGTTHYLFDAGNGVAQQLMLAGVPVTGIGRIFITHHHDDHSADWGTVMGLAWSTGRTEPIHVYGPAGTESMLQGFLQYLAPNVANRRLRNARFVDPRDMFVAHDIRGNGPVYEDANIRVTALENCHYHYEPGDPGYGTQKSYAFRIQTPDKTIVLSGDTGDCGKALVDFARGADLLVHEVVLLEPIEQQLRRDPAIRYHPNQLADLMQHMRDEHTTPEDIGRLAAAAGVKQVVLTHLVPGGNIAPDAAYSDGVKKFFNGPVVVARDLMAF
ncbi:MAG: hypothetical protein RLZZ200_1027 [Pseudomonadota bacterium]